MELKFDASKIKVVDISLVRPNGWNPKLKNTEEYRRVVESIRTNGQRLPVLVRTVEGKDGYEVVDGEQRYTACSELQYEKVVIYDFGNISDKEAKELTIWFQQQVPFDNIDLIDFFKKYKNISVDMKLPYSDEQVNKFIELEKFDWSNYKPEEKWVLPPKFYKIGLKLPIEQYTVIKDALAKMKLEMPTVEPEALLTAICYKFLKDNTV